MIFVRWIDNANPEYITHRCIPILIECVSYYVALTTRHMLAYLKLSLKVVRDVYLERSGVVDAYH